MIFFSLSDFFFEGGVSFCTHTMVSHYKIHNANMHSAICFSVSFIFTVFPRADRLSPVDEIVFSMFDVGSPGAVVPIKRTGQH